MKKFCSKCGAKMELKEREGHIFFVGGLGKPIYYKKKYNPKTGKLLRLYCCPNWGIIKGNDKWWGPYDEIYDRMNGHDFYSELNDEI